ncbi:hypothetical protein IIC38_06370 [candidate division KSB1 bacterium]|nr:hypothetical protein [candidate division KSB1 bacterium]
MQSAGGYPPRTGQGVFPRMRLLYSYALEIGFTDKTSWDKGIRDLHKVAENEHGTFCYTFFKAVGVK